MTALDWGFPAELQTEDDRYSSLNWAGQEKNILRSNYE